MLPSDLRPGDRIVWNGHPATVTHTVGRSGQRHPWWVGVRFDGAEGAAPLALQVPADRDVV